MSNDTLDTIDDTSSEVTRTDAISALGIIGFINTGIFTIVYALGTLGTYGLKGLSDKEWQEILDTAMEQYKGMISPEDMEVYDQVMPMLRENVWVLCLALTFITVFRLFSIIQMWKLKKSGLTLYAISQVLRVAVPCFILGMMGLSVFGAILAGGMTFAWFSQRKHMA